MSSEHPIVASVYAAKEDLDAADALIRSYLPFIRAEGSRTLGRILTEQDDAYSIALMAFHEAIEGYTTSRGAFLRYAALLIKSRITDFHRKEMRHYGQLSLSATGEDGVPLSERLISKQDEIHDSVSLAATKQEIAELSCTLSAFGISLTEIAENAPKQERTKRACAKAVRYAVAHPELLEELVRKKRMPLAALCKGANVDRKTMERHRTYLLSMLLIQTNGFESIRHHIRQVLTVKGEAAE